MSSESVRSLKGCWVSDLEVVNNALIRAVDSA